MNITHAVNKSTSENMVLRQIWNQNSEHNRLQIRPQKAVCHYPNNGGCRQKFLGGLHTHFSGGNLKTLLWGTFIGNPAMSVSDTAASLLPAEGQSQVIH